MRTLQSLHILVVGLGRHFDPLSTPSTLIPEYSLTLSGPDNTCTGFETVLFGVQSSADHYNALMVHMTSLKIPVFFDLVIKKPITDIAMSVEAFCLSGVNGEYAQLNTVRNVGTGVTISQT